MAQTENGTGQEKTHKDWSQGFLLLLIITVSDLLQENQEGREMLGEIPVWI